MTVKVEKVSKNSDGTVTLTIDLDEESEEIIKKFYKTATLTQEMIEKYIKESLIMATKRQRKQRKK